MKHTTKENSVSSEKHHDEKVGLFIPKKELSWIVTLGIGVALFMFITGYFWGQRQAVGQFLGKLDNESFSDKITYSLYTMNGKYVPDAEEAEDDQDAGETEETIGEEQKALEVQATLVVPQTSLLLETSESAGEKDEVSQDTITYIAPLVGFGTLHSASQFVERVKAMGINVSVKKRMSKTSKGRSVAWYQVMTDTYTDRNEIEHVVMRVQEREKIKDVKIIERKKG